MKKTGRKGVAAGIILLFVAISIIPSTAQNIEKPSLPASRGSWLFVGGNVSGNYTKIQDAIDNASDGDTVFVYAGWYNESIVINKAIIVYGQDRNTTFITGKDELYNVVQITSSNVKLKGFTIEKHIHKLDYGIIVSSCSHCQIYDNYVRTFECGIYVNNTDSLLIENNTIQNCTFSIEMRKTKNTSINGNVLEGNGKAYGIGLLRSLSTTINRNNVTNTLYGVNLVYTLFTVVKENNFFENTRDYFFGDAFLTTWSGNYWNKPHHLPKILVGNVGVFKMYPIINIDWHPALEPYDIS